MKHLGNGFQGSKEDGRKGNVAEWSSSVLAALLYRSHIKLTLRAIWRAFFSLPSFSEQIKL